MPTPDPYRSPAGVETISGTFHVLLPSRASLLFRPIGAKEMSLIGKGKHTAQERLFALLKACQVSTTDTGPYKEVVIGSATSKANWERVPWGDVFYAILGLYKGSFRRLIADDGNVELVNDEPAADRRYGDRVNFDYTCSHCLEIVKWQVDTDELLANHTPISDDVYERLIEGKELVATYRGNKEVFWLPPTQQRDAPFARLMEKQGQSEETVVELLAKHVVRVPAIGDRVQTPQAIWYWAQSLSMDDVDDLISQIDRDNYGLNSLIELVCSECGVHQAQTLPFGQIFASRRTTVSELLKRARMR